MAAITAFNFVVGGWHLATNLFSRLGLMLALCAISFTLLGALFFGLEYADTSQVGGDGSTFWTRPLRRRQVLLFYLATGWLLAFLIIGVGNYRFKHQLPTFSEFGFDLIIALVLGPPIALVVAGLLQHLRVLQRIMRDD